MLSSLLRASIFVLSNAAAGWKAAAGALMVELLTRPFVSGALGSLTQAFRFARPEWLSGLIVMVIFPGVSHLAEFTVHWLHRTPRLAAGVSFSILFSSISGLFSWYVMRRGLLIVGEADAAPLGHDLRRLPRVFAGFLVAGPLAARRLARRLKMFG